MRIKIKNKKYILVNLIIIIITLTIFIPREAYAHGVIYKNEKINDNTINVKLSWDEVNKNKNKNNINISYYFFEDSKTLRIGYQEISNNGKSEIDIVSNEFIWPVKIVLSNIDSANYSPFSDITGLSEELNIWHLHDLGIVNGIKKDVFSPGAFVTREEAAKMMVVALNLQSELVQVYELNDGENIVFSDIANSWAKDYIMVAQKHGLINGYDGKFYPQGNITIAEMSAILSRAFEFKTKINGIYNKIPQGEWYSDYLIKMLNSCVIKTDELLYINFDSSTKLTRAQSAMMISRALSTY